MTRRIMDTQELTGAYGWSESTIRRMRKSGQLRGKLFRGRWIYEASHVDSVVMTGLK
jgi:hypothetical protein